MQDAPPTSGFSGEWKSTGHPSDIVAFGAPSGVSKPCDDCSFAVEISDTWITKVTKDYLRLLCDALQLYLNCFGHLGTHLSVALSHVLAAVVRSSSD